MKQIASAAFWSAFHTNPFVWKIRWEVPAKWNGTYGKNSCTVVESNGTVPSTDNIGK